METSTGHIEPNDDTFAELKWLYPLYFESEHSKVTFTVGAIITEGLANLRVIVSGHDKVLRTTIEKVRNARQIAESWLARREYASSVVCGEALIQLYHDLDYRPQGASPLPLLARTGNGYVGAVSVDLPQANASSSLGVLLRQLLKTRMSGTVLVSFSAGQIPHLSKSATDIGPNTRAQVPLPYRIEEHKLRNTYKQMAEVEACEETGCFKLGISVFIREGDSLGNIERTLRQVRQIAQGVFGGAKIRAIPSKTLTSGWSVIALRRLSRNASIMSGARLTALLDLSTTIAGVPTKRRIPRYPVPRLERSDDSIDLGSILLDGELTAQNLYIPSDFFVHHVGIYGNPGGGKTNTAFQIVYEQYKKGVPFLVIVPAKKEWRQLGDYIPDIRVFPTRNIRFNFLSVPEGVHVSTHISNIATCFIAWWPSEGILVEHITKVFQRAYIDAGWDLHTGERGKWISITDLYEAMEEVAAELRYGGRLGQEFFGALTARFETLVNDPLLSVMFNCEHSLTVPDLIDNRTILELNDLPDKHKALVTSLLLVSIAEYLEANSSPVGLSNKLRHLLVLEEAHHVLKQVPTASESEGHSSQQQAINTIVQLLREARGLGLGLVLIDQLPAELARAAVKLPGITIIHALFDASERLLIGAHANLTGEQLTHIGFLGCGEAIVHQAFIGEAVHVRVRDFSTNTVLCKSTWNDERVSEQMRAFYLENPHLLRVNIPIIDSWKPDETVLNELRLIISEPEFSKEFRKRIAVGEESVLSYIQGIVEKSVSAFSSSRTVFRDIDSYATILLEMARGELNLQSSGAKSEGGDSVA